MEKMINKAREMTTDMILEALTIIGGGNVHAEARMARAAMIEVYMEREGEEAGDTLMDFLGL